MAKQQYVAKNKVPLPPPDAEVLTTACDYCVVACGYVVYRWPVGKEGGPKADENALGVNYPVPASSGKWISPNMHNVVLVDGKQHHVIVIPDGDSKVVNVGGTHSIRGGCIAQKCYNPNSPTKDRLQFPQIRVGDKLVRTSWEDAIEIMAEVSKHVLENYGENAWAQKQYSYQFFENTYALTKLAFRHIETVAFAFHDNPSNAEDTPGWRDMGFDNFAAAYEDYSLADTLFISGTDPYETKTVLFQSWMLKGVEERGTKMIMVGPRKTTGFAYAESKGGLHLDLIPGTDTVLHMAIIRVILENGWEDKEWIEKFTASKWEQDSGFGRGIRDTGWQWRTTWGKLQGNDFGQYREWLLSQKEAELDEASRITGVAKEKIIKAAELVAKPRADGTRPKTTLCMEKGNYWSNNYLNTASLGMLAVCCGSGNRPGQMVSRLGGHQRGGVKGGLYNIAKSPEKYPGRRRKPLDLDRWVEGGHVRYAYVVGCTWTTAMTGSQALASTLEKLTRGNPHQLTGTDKEAAIETFKKRVDSGGMMLVHQDIYLRDPIGSVIADIVLPAAAWGEDDFARANGERRLRLYSKFYDPPGEAKPDWEIVAMFGKAMGFDGFDWKESNDVFEEAARFTRGSRKDYLPLVWLAKNKGVKSHELLRAYGTHGIQGPIRYQDGELIGTKRLHDPTVKLPDTGPQGPTIHSKIMSAFNTQSGKINIQKSPWDIFSDFFEWQSPKEADGELWVTNGRVNEIWQTGFDDLERRPYIIDRWPANFLEIHPDDAKARGIESGDELRVFSDRVPVQVSGWQGVRGAGKLDGDFSFTTLLKEGHIKLEKASVSAVAIVTPAVKLGVSFMFNLHTKDPANSLAPRVPDPLSDNYRYKLGVGKIEKVGESPYKKSFEQMSFGRRDLVWEGDDDNAKA
ncbi:MAG: arsenate reductase (azurin) large subunit [Planctomycetaceae bacterium]|nr:arsenate reductase (azurin) large subunit [Planctomycetaceae bacterium]